MNSPVDSRIAGLTSPKRLPQLRAELNKVYKQLEIAQNKRGSIVHIAKLKVRKQKLESEIRERREKLLKTLSIETLNITVEELENEKNRILRSLESENSIPIRKKLQESLEKIEQVQHNKSIKNLEDFINKEIEMFRTPPPKNTSDIHDDEQEKKETSVLIEEVGGDEDLQNQASKPEVTPLTPTDQNPTSILPSRPTQSDVTFSNASLKSSTMLSTELGLPKEKYKPRSAEDIQDMNEYFNNLKTAGSDVPPKVVPILKRPKVTYDFEDWVPNPKFQAYKPTPERYKPSGVYFRKPVVMSTIEEMSPETETPVLNKEKQIHIQTRPGREPDYTSSSSNFSDLNQRMKNNPNWVIPSEYNNLFKNTTSVDYKVLPEVNQSSQTHVFQEDFSQPSFRSNFPPNTSQDSFRQQTFNQSNMNRQAENDWYNQNYNRPNQNRNFSDNQFSSNSTIYPESSRQDEYNPYGTNERVIRDFPNESTISSRIPGQSQRPNMQTQNPTFNQSNLNPPQALFNNSNMGVNLLPVRQQFLRRLKLIPKFDGATHKELIYFIDIADTLYNSCMNEYEETEFQEQMALQLRGEARQVLNDARDSNWETLKTKLYTHFSHLANKDVLNSQLENMKQEKDESLSKYVERARKLLQEKNAAYKYLTEDRCIKA